MVKKWTTLLLVLVMLLAIAACTPQKETSPQADAPAQQSVEDDDQGDQAEADQDNEGHDDDATDSDDDAMAEETTEEGSEPATPPIDAAETYAQKCSGCHGDKRQGGNGPSLLPERLTQDASVYAKTITDGKGSNMPSWEGKLSEDVITALSEWILTPVE